MLGLRAILLFGFLFIGNLSFASDSCFQLGNIWCSMEYVPTKCVIEKWDEALLAPPITASGTNECFAYVSLRSEVCARDLDPDLIDEQIVQCSVVPDTDNVGE